MLDLLKGFPSQIKEAVQLPVPIVNHPIINIVICGLGGSAIPGDILRHYLQDEIKVPIIVMRDYNVPKFVNRNTLVFAVSYSGNTAETLSAFNDARKKKAQIVGITSGGRLKNVCRKCISVPQGFPPRSAIAYLFFPMLTTLSKSGIVGNKEKEIKETIKILEHFNAKQAESIARKLKGKIPLIYASKRYAPIAYRLKTQINENSKQFAAASVFSEVNHNEVEARFDSRFAIVSFQNSKEDKRMKKQADAFEKTVSLSMNKISLKGRSALARMFYGIHFGDWISYYLAKLNKVNIQQTKRIDKVKIIIRSI